MNLNKKYAFHLINLNKKKPWDWRNTEGAQSVNHSAAELFVSIFRNLKLKLLLQFSSFKWQKIFLFMKNRNHPNWIIWFSEFLPQTNLSILVSFYLDWKLIEIYTARLRVHGYMGMFSRSHQGWMCVVTCDCFHVPTRVECAWLHVSVFCYRRCHCSRPWRDHLWNGHLLPSMTDHSSARCLRNLCLVRRLLDPLPPLVPPPDSSWMTRDPSWPNSLTI